MSARSFGDSEAAQLTTLWEKHLKGIGALGVITWLVGILAGLLGLSTVWQYLKVNSVEERITAAKQEIDTHRESLRSASANMLVPPGTVCAWPAGQPSSDSAWHTYWHACDGGEVEFTEDLWRVLKGLYGNPDAIRVERIKLPDFRGRFLRGLGGDGSNGVGIAQDGATALPHNPFTTGGGGDGEHAHKFTGFGHQTSKGEGGGVSLNGHFLQWEGGTADKFLDRGGHSHTIVSGGDAETRPKNYAIHWVIRIQ